MHEPTSQKTHNAHSMVFHQQLHDPQAVGSNVPWSRPRNSSQLLEVVDDGAQLDDEAVGPHKVVGCTSGVGDDGRKEGGDGGLDCEDVGLEEGSDACFIPLGLLSIPHICTH
jgi:hypothetical protein